MNGRISEHELESLMNDLDTKNFDDMNDYLAGYDDSYEEYDDGRDLPFDMEDWRN